MADETPGQDEITRSLFSRWFGAGVPAYLWLVIIYVIFVAIALVGGGVMEVFTTETTHEDGSPLSVAEKLEAILNSQLFAIPLFSGAKFGVTITTLFLVAGFLTSWIEVLRAATSRTSGNDFLSLIVTVISLLLFVGVDWFATTAFLIIVVVGVGDLILDRYVGQAVARRDFGGVPYGG